jgi:hypothetical protein
VFDPDVAQAALGDAQKAGKLRYISFTGHKDPHTHLYKFEEADCRGVHFDAAQMPFNLMDVNFRSFAKLDVPELFRRGIAMLGMKSLVNGILLIWKL